MNLNKIWIVFVLFLLVPTALAYTWTRPPFTINIINGTIYGGENDTNESVRMGNLVNNECAVGNYVFNFSQNGTPQCSVPANGTYLPIGGGTMQGSIDMDGYSLTNVGELIVAGLTTSQDIIPTTDNLYDLGNTTNWWSVAYIKSVYSNNIYTTNLNASSINTTNLKSSNVNSTVVDVQNNLSVAGYEIREEGGNLLIVLT